MSLYMVSSGLVGSGYKFLKFRPHLRESLNQYINRISFKLVLYQYHAKIFIFILPLASGLTRHVFVIIRVNYPYIAARGLTI